MPYRRFSEVAGSGANDQQVVVDKPQKRLSLPHWEPFSPKGKKNGTPRIPKSLQNVFLAAAQGQDITEAPVKDKSFIKKLGKSKSKRKKKGSAGSIDSDQPTAHQLQDPQRYLDRLLANRGYSTQKYQSLRCAYHCKPSELQQASYGIQVVKAVRNGDVRLLKMLLDAGLSPCPCNMYGESLMHLVCRRGDHKVLDALLQYGCPLQISDDYGRTPLHDACWQATPDFETIKLILDEDIHLVNITDARGATPLSYASKENWPQWIDFIDSIKESYWPIRDVNVHGYEEPPFRVQLQPDSTPVNDPPNALDIDVAFKVASGEMEIFDLLFMDDDSDTDDDDCSVTTDSEGSSTHALDAGYDDDDFLTPEEIAMTLAKYEYSKHIVNKDLIQAVSNVKTSTEGLLVEG